MPTEFRSGFAALIGRSNVGKSTLMNALVGEKVAIVSDRPQTTRNSIRGVICGEDYQLVLVDTPGLHKARTRLGDYMVKSALGSLEGVDMALAVFDASEHFGPGDRAVLEQLANIPARVIAVLNKIDKIPKQELLPRMAQLGQYPFIAEIVPVSALKREGLDALRDVLAAGLKPGPRYFAQDEYTDQPLRVIAAELIREKAINQLREEVPHGIGVEILQFAEDQEEGRFEVHANILCERQSHKAILIGKQGSMLKLIGTQARRELQGIAGAPVHLELWVKVSESWRDNPARLRDLGYDSRDL